MNDFFSHLQSLFQRYWQRLNLQQKVMVSVLTVVFLVSTIGLSFYVAKPEFSPLFTNLSPEDASVMLTKLKESKSPFEIADGGRTIKVPTKNLYELRLAMASEGLPQGGSLGFEIFDKSFFGMSDFNQRLNFQRALQGELERTIRQVSSIENARVHLVLPEKELYSENQKEPTASVILKMKPGAKLDKSQVKAIVNLVRTSVEGLKEGNISIVDTNGVMLSRPFSEDASSYTTEVVNSHFELKKIVERNIEEQILTMMDMILGPGKAVVRANVELDLAKKESTEELYTPVIDNKEGIIRSQQKKTETFKGQGQSGGASGVPGTASNSGAPSYPSVQSGGGSNSSDSIKDESVTNYEINKKVEHQVSVPGEIKKLSVSVLVDGTFTPEKIATIKQVVASGIGMNTQRGDQLVVESMQFDKSYMEKEKAEMERFAHKEFISNTARTGSIVFVSIILALFFLSMLRHRSVMKRTTDEIRRTQEAMPVMEMPASAGGMAEAAAVAAAQSGMGMAADMPPPTHKELEPEIKDQVESLVRDKPKDIADAIKFWLSKGA